MRRGTGEAVGYMRLGHAQHVAPAASGPDAETCYFMRSEKPRFEADSVKVISDWVKLRL
ncbi:MAG: hypothetical protein GX492_03480 [Firmicutes bacterium]|nr:hypothetical protein [Bacillota bacterium]